MLQRAIGSPGVEVRTGILAGSCCVPGDGWSYPTLTRRPCPQKVPFASPSSSIQGMSNSAGSPSFEGDDNMIPPDHCPGVWNKPFPFHTSITTSTAGEFWKFASLFWKKQNRKGRKEGKRTRVGKKKKKEKKKRKEEKRGEVGEHKESYLCSLLH